MLSNPQIQECGLQFHDHEGTGCEEGDVSLARAFNAVVLRVYAGGW